MTLHRFAYGTNLERATGDPGWSHAFRPPAYDDRPFDLDLANEVPALGAGLHAELETLRAAAQAEWQRCHALNGNALARMQDAATIVRCLHRIAELLPGDADRRALGLRVDRIERGQLDGARVVLAGINEDITIVAGNLATSRESRHRGIVGVGIDDRS